MSEHEPIDSETNLVEFEPHRLAEGLPAAKRAAKGNFKDAALSIAKKLDGAARSVRIAKLPARRNAPSFKDHALYQSMLKYRLIGDTVGLADPFFKQHEARPECQRGEREAGSVSTSLGEDNRGKYEHQEDGYSLRRHEDVD